MIDDLKRFWRKVDKNGPDGCWIWTGAATSGGYGQIYSGEKKRGRAVLSLATHVALAIDGRFKHGARNVAMHRCDNPRCVNPGHLRWGTVEENLRDCRRKGRAGHQVIRRGQEAVAERADGKRQALLSDAVVRLIRVSSQGGSQLAKRLGVSPETVRNVRAGRTYKHVKPI